MAVENALGPIAQNCKAIVAEKDAVVILIFCATPVMVNLRQLKVHNRHTSPVFVFRWMIKYILYIKKIFTVSPCRLFFCRQNNILFMFFYRDEARRLCFNRHGCLGIFLYPWPHACYKHHIVPPDSDS